MTEILAFVGFLSFLSTAIIVIYGWYSWRTDWEQKYEKKDKELLNSMECRCKEFNERLERLEHQDLV